MYKNTVQYTVIEDVNNKQLIDLDSINVDILDFNKIYNLKFGNVGSEIYILTIGELKKLMNIADNEITIETVEKYSSEPFAKPVNKEQYESVNVEKVKQKMLENIRDKLRGAIEFAK